MTVGLCSAGCWALGAERWAPPHPRAAGHGACGSSGDQAACSSQRSVRLSVSLSGPRSSCGSSREPPSSLRLCFRACSAADGTRCPERCCRRAAPRSSSTPGPAESTAGKGRRWGWKAPRPPRDSAGTRRVACQPGRRGVFGRTPCCACSPLPWSFAHLIAEVQELVSNICRIMAC